MQRLKLGRGSLRGLAAFACILGIGRPLEAEGVPTAVLEAASASVVKIKATKCSTPSRAASGFIAPQAGFVITALHVVNGCGGLQVYFKDLGWRAATLEKALPRGDLALLRVADPPPRPPLKPALAAATRTDELVALGYPLDVPSMIEKRLSPAFGSSRLADMLPPGIRDEVQRAGTPSLELKILRLEGHLQPGMSGAPLLSASGEVVGIADGGLENGAAGISWAVPVALVNDLLASVGEALPSERLTSGLFAVDVESRAGGAVVRCGSVELTKVRTRPFQELASSSDDPAAIQQLLASMGSGIDASKFTFDIYVDGESGATVALPEGTRLTPVATGCAATRNVGELRIVVERVSSAIEANYRGMAFEQSLGAQSGLLWQQDTTWSYAAPSQRFDGLIVNRKAFLGTNPLTYQTAYAVESLMTRGNGFLAVLAVNSRYAELSVQQTACLMLGNCGAYQVALASWMWMVFGVHLSTFPIG